MQRRLIIVCMTAACGRSPVTPDGYVGPPGDGPMISACPLLPANHVFNTAIDALPVDPNSDAYITTIGATRKLHLDLGTQTDQQAADFYGIPFNVVSGTSIPWPTVAFFSADPGVSWNPLPESDCADASHGVVSPCVSKSTVLPFPTGAVVEGGIERSTTQMPYGDHHLLVVDVDACRLWETFHVYSPR